MYLANSGWKLIKNIVIARFGNTKLTGNRTFFDLFDNLILATLQFSSETINLMNTLIQYFIYGAWWGDFNNIIMIKLFLPFCLMCIIRNQ